MKIWPFLGNTRVTSMIGDREMYFRDEKHVDFHKGWDVAMPIGSDIIMPENGTIISGEDPDSIGKFIVLDGDKYRWNFWHLSKVIIASGLVNAGDLAAKSGNSGLSTGPHCHMQIAKRAQASGEFIDPRTVFDPDVIMRLDLPGHDLKHQMISMTDKLDKAMLHLKQVEVEFADIRSILSKLKG